MAGEAIVVITIVLVVGFVALALWAVISGLVQGIRDERQKKRDRQR